jgi:hypothetical protein
MDEDLLFEQSYLIDALPGDSMSLSAIDDGGANLPAAIASAAYGYTRGGQFSPLYAGLFGFFGYSYPLISTLIIAGDALFNTDTPARRAAAAAYAKHGSSFSKKLGFSGLSGNRNYGKHCIRHNRKTRRCSKYVYR